MKFINYLEKITGVDILGLTSLGIFFSFFILILLWMYKADKKTLDKINHLPLDN
ncbi:MAG: cytochrome C oxidase Cbb3 [Bacteroidetes bacterium 24-39-8]|jgi:hypothetical protein|nr:MAG: cytochrome C oxidase Cbb3 [Sphingobacteriia bacterium 35-40-5]OYZ49951.1 MAG: cytochrome C oxidase Cbb3 [Bacteroidetes bacterium 24-39-8]